MAAFKPIDPAITREQFDALTPDQQRVAIAKDVLLQVRAHRIVAEDGVYVGRIGTARFEAGAVERFITRHRCAVCAIGAAFVSAVRLGDNVNEAEFSDFLWEGGARLGDTPIRKHPSQFFEPRQLALIETAFEQDVYWYENAMDCGEDSLPEEAEDAADFSDSRDPSERLVEIMQNIIDHGKFVPALKPLASV